MYRSCVHKAAMSLYAAVERGAPNSLDYRLFLRGPNGYVSPWHDIPLFANDSKDVFNMVVEIPRWSNAKMEIATTDRLNPIKQDIKKGKLRYVHNVFPHHGYIWNYGALPQTWENPDHADPDTGAKGDNDPIDVCEIGHRVCRRGDVIQVKVLGTLALIDEGETDWKVLAIDVNDPLARKLNDIDDIEREMPGFLAASREWFRLYKIPTGKPENKFGFDGEFQKRDYALERILETHQFWRSAVTASGDKGLDWHSVAVPDAPNRISKEDAGTIVDATAESKAAEPISDEVDQWHYVKV